MEMDPAVDAGGSRLMEMDPIAYQEHLRCGDGREHVRYRGPGYLHGEGESEEEGARICGAVVAEEEEGARDEPVFAVPQGSGCVVVTAGNTGLLTPGRAEHKHKTRVVRIELPGVTEVLCPLLKRITEAALVREGGDIPNITVDRPGGAGEGGQARRGEVDVIQVRPFTHPQAPHDPRPPVPVDRCSAEVRAGKTR